MGCFRLSPALARKVLFLRGELEEARRPTSRRVHHTKSPTRIKTNYGSSKRREKVTCIGKFRLQRSTRHLPPLLAEGPLGTEHHKKLAFATYRRPETAILGPPSDLRCGSFLPGLDLGGFQGRRLCREVALGPKTPRRRGSVRSARAGYVPCGSASGTRCSWLRFRSEAG